MEIKYQVNTFKNLKLLNIYIEVTKKYHNSDSKTQDSPIQATKQYNLKKNKK